MWKEDIKNQITVGVGFLFVCLKIYLFEREHVPVMGGWGEGQWKNLKQTRP